MAGWLRGWYGDNRQPARAIESNPLLFRVLLIWSRPSARREDETVQRSQVNIVVVAALMLVSASLSLAAEPKAPAGAARGAVVSGIVRDAKGMALMGAVIQVMANDSVTAATAFTDLHGRYVVANLLPGKYHVRASATLFVPALRDNLQLRSGARTVVNLTLSTLFESTAWLPA